MPFDAKRMAGLGRRELLLLLETATVCSDERDARLDYMKAELARVRAERDALFENLTSTQERCSELLEISRGLDREIEAIRNHRHTT